MWAVGGQAGLKVSDEVLAVLFGFLMEAGWLFGQAMIGGLDADGWANAVEPGFEIGLNLDEMFALGGVLGEHKTELGALFDELVLAQIRRRRLAGS